MLRVAAGACRWVKIPCPLVTNPHAIGQAHCTKLSWLQAIVYDMLPMDRKVPPASVCEGARQLRAWRVEHKLSQARTCALLGVSHIRTCHEWEWGAKIPSFLYAARIEEITDGGVPVEAWGYTDADCAPLIAFGIRRARKAGLIPPLPIPPPRSAPIILRPR